MRLLLAVLLLSPIITPGAQQPTPTAPCDTAARSHIFDFWLGTWDVYPTAAPVAQAPRIGVNIITSIERGCALLEQWTNARGGTGRSFNWYDTNLGTWRQLWIDQGGNTLDYSRGEYRDGAMRFSGWTRNAAGQRVEQKLTFFNIHPDTVRQLFEASRDSGRTWQSTFDARYVRRSPTPLEIGILEEVDRSGERIRLASATFELVGMPPIDVRLGHAMSTSKGEGRSE